jgi:ATP-binding cassette, subfamily F, member 3
MIQLSGAGKRFGHKLLLEKVDWLITARDRVGLVGANGTGKSTLMKILAGMDTLDYGALTIAKGTSAGYLPQDGLTLSGRTVFAECMAVFDDLRAMEKELESLTHSMAELDHTSAQFDAVADRYHVLEHEFRTRDGYSIEAEVGRVLTGLGFSKEDWERQTDEFSGGWQMRLALAKLLLQKPNLLLLDEPTNHLDLEARNWLEKYLQDYPNAFVLISHDRYFLDVTVNKIAEIWNKRFWFYSGNYDKFLTQKTLRNEQLQAAYKNQRERIEQLEVFINRFRYQATKAKQVQSRIKELERMERIEVPPEEKTIHFKFPQPRASGRIVAEFEDVAKRYPAHARRSIGPQSPDAGERFPEKDQEVFRHVSFMIERGDRIALVGVNGAGKSTLIKLLAGTERLSAGAYRLGHNVQADYFAQDQYKELDPEARILDDLGELSPRSTETELRSLLGCFLFSEEDVFKKIGVLSGGERGRYALLRTFCCWMSPPITSTCAPKTSCSTRSWRTRAQWFSFHTTATSSTSWRRGCSKSGTARSRRFPGITRIICGAKRAGNMSLRRWRTCQVQFSQNRREVGHSRFPPQPHKKAGKNTRRRMASNPQPKPQRSA